MNFTTRKDAAGYIATMAKELAQIATAHGLDVLEHLLEMVASQAAEDASRPK